MPENLRGIISHNDSIVTSKSKKSESDAHGRVLGFEFIGLNL